MRLEWGIRTVQESRYQRGPTASVWLQLYPPGESEDNTSVHTSRETKREHSGSAQHGFVKRMQLEKAGDYCPREEKNKEPWSLGLQVGAAAS